MVTSKIAPGFGACESEAGGRQKQVSSPQPVSHSTSVASVTPAVIVPPSLVCCLNACFLGWGDYARIPFGEGCCLALTVVQQLQNIDARMLRRHRRCKGAKAKLLVISQLHLGSGWGFWNL